MTCRRNCSYIFYVNIFRVGDGGESHVGQRRHHGGPDASCARERWYHPVRLPIDHRRGNQPGLGAGCQRRPGRHTAAAAVRGDLQASRGMMGYKMATLKISSASL